MIDGIKTMGDIFEAFRRPVPASSADGTFTIDELLRFLDQEATGFGVQCEVLHGKYVTVQLTILGTHNSLDDDGARLTREGAATIQNEDIWAAYQTALLRAAKLWGLNGGSLQDANLDHLLSGADFNCFQSRNDDA